MVAQSTKSFAKAPRARKAHTTSTTATKPKRSAAPKAKVVAPTKSKATAPASPAAPRSELFDSDPDESRDDGNEVVEEDSKSGAVIQLNPNSHAAESTPVRAAQAKSTKDPVRP